MMHRMSRAAITASRSDDAPNVARSHIDERYLTVSVKSCLRLSYSRLRTEGIKTGLMTKLSIFRRPPGILTGQTVVLLPVALIILNGCFGSVSFSGEPVVMPVRVLYESVHCSGVDSSPNLVEITGDPQLKSVLHLLNGSQLENRNQQLPQVDFAAERAFFVTMGQKRTGGYSVALHQDRAVVSKGVAQISVLWIQPSAEDVVTQALTNPCIFMALPRGDYSRVVIVDQNGDQRMQAATADP